MYTIFFKMIIEAYKQTFYLTKSYLTYSLTFYKCKEEIKDIKDLVLNSKLFTVKSQITYVQT